jgi:hypothetical protein
MTSTTQTQKVGAVLAFAGILAGFGLLLYAGTGSAALASANITADQPDNQTVDVVVSFSGSTDATAELSRDGSVVESTTVSGTSGDTKTLPLDMSGLASGEFALDVSATDESVVTVENTTMVTTKPAQLNVTQNETVVVDVGFDASNPTNATVQLTNSETVLNESTLQFDPVEAEDGTGIKTAKWEADADYSAVNVTVETIPASGYSEMWVDLQDSSGLFGGGIVAGANRNQILGFLVVLGGLIVARNRELI